MHEEKENEIQRIRKDIIKRWMVFNRYQRIPLSIQTLKQKRQNYNSNA
jgi:hypothetical protein